MLSPIEAQEYQLIRDTLIEANGGIRRAATKFRGMSPQALLRRLEKWPELRVEKPDSGIVPEWGMEFRNSWSANRPRNG